MTAGFAVCVAATDASEDEREAAAEALEADADETEARALDLEADAADCEACSEDNAAECVDRREDTDARALDLDEDAAAFDVATDDLALDLEADAEALDTDTTDLCEVTDALAADRLDALATLATLCVEREDAFEEDAAERAVDAAASTELRDASTDNLEETEAAEARL